MTPMNLAGVLPWTYGRAVVVVAQLATGNFFLHGLPIHLAARTGAQVGLATHHWPAPLHTKWLAVAFLI